MNESSRLVESPLLYPLTQVRDLPGLERSEGRVITTDEIPWPGIFALGGRLERGWAKVNDVPVLFDYVAFVYPESPAHRPHLDKLHSTEVLPTAIKIPMLGFDRLQLHDKL